MKKYKRIAFDIDNTLTLLQPTLDMMAEHFGTLPVVEDDVLDFRLSESYSVSREQELDFWKTQESKLCEQSVFALKRVQMILEQYAADDAEYLYITARDDCYSEETISWIVSTGMPSGKISLLGKKSKLEDLKEWGADVIFEDSPSFFHEWKDSLYEKDMDAYCISYPYNKDCIATEHLCRDTGLPVDYKEPSELEKIVLPASFFWGEERSSLNG